MHGGRPRNEHFSNEMDEKQTTESLANEFNPQKHFHYSIRKSGGGGGDDEFVDNMRE